MIGTIDAILAAHGLPPAHRVDQPAAGQNNPIYLIDDAYVVRFDGLTDLDETDPELTTRFHAEQWVYDQLWTAGLPVPRVVVVDDTRTLAPDPYMLMTQIAGHAVVDSAELTPDQRIAIASEFGTFLARMHDVTSFDRFGRWHQLQDGTHYARWSEWPVSFFEKYARLSEELGGAVDAAFLRDFRRMIDDAMPFFDAVTTGVIAHRDAHPGNAMQANSRLTGVLDFEWWMAADPACDFAVEDQWERFGTGCRDAIYAAYTALRPLTPGHHAKTRVYHLLRYFDEIVSAYSFGNVEAARRTTAMVRAKLDGAPIV